MTEILRPIGVIARALESIANIEFQQYDLTRGQYLYLVRIAEQPGIIQERLGELLKVDRATVTRAVQQLIKHGLVERHPDKTNRKIKHLYLTAAGRAVYPAIKAENDYSNQMALTGLTTDEAHNLEALLNKVSANVAANWDFVKKGHVRHYYNKGGITMPIQAVTLNQLPDLQSISRETFTATFGAENAAEDLANYLEEAYNTDRLTSELENPDSFFYFIYQDGEVAGYLKLNIDGAQTEKAAPDSLEIERIYIRQSFKRLGLGTQLINHALTVAQQFHKTNVWLGVWEHNTAALNFYKNLGFSQVGDHIFQLGSDAQRDLIMQKTLTV